MNIVHREKIVLLGFLSHFPVAGVAWQTVHYLVGLQRLGFDVYYVEAHGCTPSKLMRSETDDGAARAAEYISGIMHQFGLGHRWAYHAIYDSRYFGLSKLELSELYRSAGLIINLHGSHLPRPELYATNRLVYLETDPVDVEIDLFHKRQETVDYLSPHCAFFTFGENLGGPGCLLPIPQPWKFIPTRQPVVLDFWEHYGAGSGEVFTTIGNWRQPWREVEFKGEVYRWSKHFEFEKVLDLPRRVSQPFELALSSYDEKDQVHLEACGWRVRPALEISTELHAYRQYIGQSRGEFTVAKDQNVRLRSGWFSDRAATYLAAGRPVITQDTGFDQIIPTGEGLFSFSTLEQAVAAVERVNKDYIPQRRAAFQVAREYFSHEVVLTGILKHLGLSLPTISLNGAAHRALPSQTVIVPTSRWPTRLPRETIELALALPMPVAEAGIMGQTIRASVILVTHNSLPFTKMCLCSLFESGWNPVDELLIVDNASTDGSVAYFEELERRNGFIRVLFNKSNLGFATANNQALRQAKGDYFILLNNDTLVTPGWQEKLIKWLHTPRAGLVGPVTNRTCNEAQVNTSYKGLAEMKQFAAQYTAEHVGKANDIRMLAMFCLGIRRSVFEEVGPLDEQFELGMFEDDDYARRVHDKGYRILCAEDVFVHHFGQASFGELCYSGKYDPVFDANRLRFETKWGIKWEPHARRITPEYANLRQRIKENAQFVLPEGSTVLVISKGDEELINFPGRSSWHFPRAEDGDYGCTYPAQGREAVAHLESLRDLGARFLLVPKPAFWWLEHYGEFREYLTQKCRLTFQDEETCLIFDLGNDHA